MKPSRYMLTGEISWALVAISFAWSGMGGWPLAESYLSRMLGRLDDAGMLLTTQFLWATVIGIPALILLFVSGREWWAHKRHAWTMFQVERSSRLRARMCLVMFISWVYMLKVMIEGAIMSMFPNGAQMFDVPRANAMLPIAFFGALCMLWFWWENKRVMRDVRKATGVYPAYPSR